ncbi:hypothetical protein D0817_20695 [Flavobacterium cupreum]|uniref:Uncharacterized protein n=1 Tax=Flavobacterium cupreum TaxID=2133766 RepID=A0A434A2H5_9FLAO|nr:hypothetical protein [Flavobacterium cupreum]RUT68546.1 hypothetical protein D0817_20695 [Flavobacterium cupreum]
MKDKFLDYYVNGALFLDALLVCIVWICNSNFSLISFIINSKEDNISIISDIISASISLAGFILAALTIIAAMRSNITNKAPEAAKNPLELFFSNGNYKSIVKVFVGSIKELVFVFIVAYIVWICKENLKNDFLFRTIVSMSLLMFLSVIRSLAVLFRIIHIND